MTHRRTAKRPLWVRGAMLVLGLTATACILACARLERRHSRREEGGAL